MRKIWIVGALVILAAAVGILVPRLSPLASVPSGSVGMVTRGGALARVVEPGTAIKLPVLESVAPVSLRPVSRKFLVADIPTKDGDLLGLRLVVIAEINKAGIAEGFARHHTDMLAELDLMVPVIARREVARIATRDLPDIRAGFGEALHKALVAAQPSYLKLTSVIVEVMDFHPYTLQVIGTIAETRLLKAREESRKLAEETFLEADKARVSKELYLERLREDASRARALRDREEELLVVAHRMKIDEQRFKLDETRLRSMAPVLALHPDVLRLLTVERGMSPFPLQSQNTPDKK